MSNLALINHKAKKSNNPKNNSGLWKYVISARKTSAVHITDIKILISTTDNYYHRRPKTHSSSLITASWVLFIMLYALVRYDAKEWPFDESVWIKKLAHQQENETDCCVVTSSHITGKISFITTTWNKCKPLQDQNNFTLKSVCFPTLTAWDKR